MKKYLILLALTNLLMPGAALASTTISQGDKQISVITEGIRFCESTYPLKDKMLIANFGTEQLNPLNTEGKGYILGLKDGKTEVFIPADGNLSAPKGMFEKDGYLYICDVNKLVVYHLNALDKAPQVIPFQADDLFLNDLAASGNTLYISVTNSGRIYKIDISSPAELSKVSPTVWMNIVGPNGIIIEGNAMYIASYPADGKTTDKNVIYKVSDLNHPVAKPFFNVPGQYDGIALSADKSTLYISNWTPAEVTAVNVKSKKQIKLPVGEGLIGPADMTWKNGALFIPDLPNSRVLIYELK